MENWLFNKAIKTENNIAVGCGKNEKKKKKNEWTTTVATVWYIPAHTTSLLWRRRKKRNHPKIEIMEKENNHNCIDVRHEAAKIYNRRWNKS